MPLPENNILFYWTAPKRSFFILTSGAEVCGLDLLVCEKLFAGAGHGKAAGFKDIANVSGFQRHICVLLD